MKLIKVICLILVFIMVLSSSAAFTASAARSQEAEPSGAHLRFTVNVDKTNYDGDLAFNYYFIVEDLGYVLQDGDTLEYDVWISIEQTGWGHIDGDIDGANLRDRGFRDHEGTSFHTGQDISYFAYNRWFRRRVQLGFSEENAAAEGVDRPTAGSVLNSIQLSMHPAVPEDLYQGYVLYDNIVITNNGEIQLVIFQNEGDLDPEAFRLSHQRGSTSTVELLVFTEADEQAFRDAEAERERVAAEREAARIEAAAERERQAEEAAAERERLAEEAAAQAEAEAAAEETEEAPTTTAASPATDDDGMNIGIIIGIIAGVIIIAVIIIIAAKKKGG